MGGITERCTEICTELQNLSTTKQKGLSRQPMQITSTNRTAFSSIHIDCVGLLCDNDQGFKYIFTFEDELTRYFGAVPTIQLIR